MTFICGICGKEHPDFKGIWGDWCDHLKAGDEMKDWVEVPRSWLPDNARQHKMVIEETRQ